MNLMTFLYTINTIIPIVIITVFFFVLLFVLLLKYKTKKTADKFDDLYIKLSEEIKSAVTPKFVTVAIEANGITDLAVEVWRMEQRITKSATSLPENQLKGLENSIQKLKRYLEKYDVQIVDYKNVKYNEGLNLDILSVEKDPTLPESVVKETVEPTIILKGQVVRKAKIILLSNH